MHKLYEKHEYDVKKQLDYVMITLYVIVSEAKQSRMLVFTF
jgi:hypothetical protein